MTPLSPCRIAADALGLSTPGVAWDGPPGALLCALERRFIEPGERFVPFTPGPNFLDDASIERSPVASAAAAAFLTKKAMMATQRMVFSAEGAFSLATDAARTWFFTSPPKPPYVAVIADSMLQHLVWRAPVNLSQDVIRWRQGQRVHTARRARLLDAAERLKAHEGQVFAVLDREGKKPGHGVLRRECPPELAAHLADLTPGELIALATLAKRNPVAPQRPAPITISQE